MSQAHPSHQPGVSLLTALTGTGLVLLAFSACTPTAQPETTSRAPGPAAPLKETAPKAPKARVAAIKEVDISQLFALRAADKTLIYDVRLPFYYKLGHINGAILFYPKPFDEAFDREEAAMKKALLDGKEIVLYCGSEDCNDSHIVAEMIAKRGIPVSVYSGGWMEWKAIGMD